MHSDTPEAAHEVPGYSFLNAVLHPKRNQVSGVMADSRSEIGRNRGT